MPRLIDLSVTLGGPSFSGHGGHPGVVQEKITRHEDGMMSNTKISFSIHTGTHVDCPHHFTAEGTTIDEMPLDKYMGPAVLVDLRPRSQPNRALTVEDFLACYAGKLPLEDRIVVAWTGWLDQTWGSLAFYADNPYFSPELSQWLVDQKVRAVAVDISVEKLPKGARPLRELCPCHRIFLTSNVPLIENLANCSQLPTDREFELWALPVKIHRGDGAPARVVARV